jgi:hypothetical protein
MTSKRERARYIRLIPDDEKVTYRSFVVDLAYEEGAVTYNKSGDVVLHGEPGYAHYKKEEEKALRKIHRQEWKSPNARAKKAAQKKARRYDEAQWRKKNFDIY